MGASCCARGRRALRSIGASPTGRLAGARSQRACTPPSTSAAASAAKRERGVSVRCGGRKVLMVRPPVPFDKGLGIAALLRGASVAAALYVGDDTTDLDAFRGLRELVRSGSLDSAVCVAVSSDEAPPELAEEADLTVDGPGGVRGVLGALL